MLEMYEVVIETGGYAVTHTFPDPFQGETVPTGLFVHTPNHLLEKVGIASGVGVDGSRNCVSIVSMSHAEESKTIFDFREYCLAVSDRKIPGLRIHTESQIFVAPIVAMRMTTAQSMEVIIFVFPAEANSMNLT